MTKTKEESPYLRKALSLLRRREGRCRLDK